MRVSDLDLRELLDFGPTGGVITFAGQRALLIDAVALGLLRKELIDTVGIEIARGVLTRFGFAHGWRTAESMKAAFPWDNEREWKIAGGRLHMLQGMVVFEPTTAEAVTHAPNEPFADIVWHRSYEAEQHALHLGRSDEPVCWTLTGFASGYLSYGNGREIYVLEDRCAGAGDPHCHALGRERAAWGAAIDPHLTYYQAECIEAALARTTAALKRAERALRETRRELRAAAEGSDDADESDGLIARSEGMRKVLDLARRVAGVDTTVLVTGESGVGKERVARRIHDRSSRAGKPFVAVNCGAVSETLLESELFGHARGSFTGAVTDRAGLFEAAAGGTLFLDEIGEVTPALQVKLLRALQEREVRRVGENKSRAVDVRVLAATNKDLTDEVSHGRFRQDLYYRLRVIELHIPPLRERSEDVLPLARAMLVRTAARLGRRVQGFTPAAIDQLARYRWPGNVRELENAIERAVVLCEGERIGPEDLPEEIRASPRSSLALGEVRTLEQIEREYILAALRANGGNQARTAAQLAIGTATLYRKLKRYQDEAGSPGDGRQ